MKNHFFKKYNQKNPLQIENNNNKFAIISNNCWGGEYYKEINLPYNTPFIGLFIPPMCYLKLLKNFDYYINGKLYFTNSTKYDIYNELREQNANYPIALLSNEIEVHFLHYATTEEAEGSWNRRLKRFKGCTNYYYKFCDREIIDVNMLYEFDKLPINNKVCFTVRSLDREYKSIIQIKEQKKLCHVSDGASLYSISKNYFNPIRWIKTGDGSLNIFEHLRLRSRLIRLSFFLLIKSFIRIAKQ